jgi:serine/threonine protein kinase
LIGSRLDHYQILSLLGRGGMGEVYLASDTRLGRKVAIKLLPVEFTRDAERMRRFEQKARAASSLNHPNIITIHEIGLAGRHHFIVSEFVEGETLRQRMKSGPLGLKVALEITAQVASALQAAHRAGITHRDIKPENVMLRPDGLVKVLDFGLAKQTEPQTPTLDSQDSTLDRAEYRDRSGDGHAALYVAGAGARAEGGSPHGHLQPGCDALRDDCGA